jgi:hypothetical protein
MKQAVHRGTRGGSRWTPWPWALIVMLAVGGGVARADAASLSLTLLCHRN